MFTFSVNTHSKRVIAEYDCDHENTRLEYITCPNEEALLKKYCYKCYIAERSEEAIVCDGLSEEEIREKCLGSLSAHDEDGGNDAGHDDE